MAEHIDPTRSNLTAGEGAKQAEEVFGDSGPDLIDPQTAEFRRADDDPEYHTTRENIPEPNREGAEELAKKRSDDNLEIVATPSGPEFSEEIAELRPNPKENREGEQHGS